MLHCLSWFSSLTCVNCQPPLSVPFSSTSSILSVGLTSTLASAWRHGWNMHKLTSTCVLSPAHLKSPYSENVKSQNCLIPDSHTECCLTPLNSSSVHSCESLSHLPALPPGLVMMKKHDQRYEVAHISIQWSKHPTSAANKKTSKIGVKSNDGAWNLADSLVYQSLSCSQ